MADDLSKIEDIEITPLNEIVQPITSTFQASEGYYVALGERWLKIEGRKFYYHPGSGVFLKSKSKCMLCTTINKKETKHQQFAVLCKDTTKTSYWVIECREQMRLFVISAESK